MSKQGAASKWNGGRARYDERTVEDDRFVKKAKGWRRVQDTPTEVDYVERRKERAGFRKGARISQKTVAAELL